jgi:hypothetical protein
MAGYIEELTELVVSGKRSQKTVEQLQQSISPAALKSLSRGDYGTFLSQSLAKYALQPPGAEESKILANAVSTNIAHIYTALDRT